MYEGENMGYTAWDEGKKVRSDIIRKISVPLYLTAGIIVIAVILLTF